MSAPFYWERTRACYSDERFRQIVTIDSSVEGWANATVDRGGCSSGNISGTSEDLARCVVVALDLSDNDLAGKLTMSTLLPLRNLQILDLSMNPGLGRAGTNLSLGDAWGRWSNTSVLPAASEAAAPWPELRVLNVENCLLGGELPPWLFDIPTSLRLGKGDAGENAPGNRFLYTAPAEGEFNARSRERARNIQRLIDRCRLTALSCDGLPMGGGTCAAFGEGFVVNAANPDLCTQCSDGDRATSVLAVLTLVVSVVALLAFYICLVRRYQNSMRAGVTTVSILVAHVQTIAIVGNLRLHWPPSVEQFTEVVSLSFVDASYLRPECLTDANTNAFTLMSVSQVGGLLGFLMLIGAATVCCSPEWSDHTHFLLTVLLAFFFPTSWRLAYRLIEQASSGQPAMVVGVWLACAVMLIELVFVFRYLYMVTQQEHSTNQLVNAYIQRAKVGPVSRESMRIVENAAMVRYESRTRFLTRRFAKHAPHWQFVVWLRQFVLFLDYALPNLVLDFSLASMTDEERIPITRAVVWVYATLAVFILLGSWRLHFVVQPYYFAFQNSLEHLLFFSDVAAVTLGTLYTAFFDAGMSAGLQHFLEFLLLSAFLGGVVAAAAWVSYGYYRGRLSITQAAADAERKAKAEEAEQRRSEMIAAGGGKSFYRTRMIGRMRWLAGDEGGRDLLRLQHIGWDCSPNGARADGGAQSGNGSVAAQPPEEPTRVSFRDRLGKVSTSFKERLKRGNRRHHVDGALMARAGLGDTPPRPATPRSANATKRVAADPPRSPLKTTAFREQTFESLGITLPEVLPRSPDKFDGVGHHGPMVATRL